MDTDNESFTFILCLLVQSIILRLMNGLTCSSISLIEDASGKFPTAVIPKWNPAGEDRYTLDILEIAERICKVCLGVLYRLILPHSFIKQSDLFLKFAEYCIICRLFGTIVYTLVHRIIDKMNTL